MTEQLLCICPVHGTWDLDYEPPRCSCEFYELLSIEGQQELPFYEALDEAV